MIEKAFADFQKAMGPENCFFGGPKDADESAAAPRITWQPIGSKLGAPQQLRTADDHDDSILTRQWVIQVDIWGRDLTETQKLADLFLATAQDQFTQGTYQPGTETWKATGQTGNGAICSMLIYIWAPVLRTRYPMATISEIRATFRLPTAPDVVSTFTKP